MDAALSQIVTDAPTGNPPPVPSVPTVPGGHPADLTVDPEERAVLAHRATLADEERRLELRRAQNPMPVAVPAARGLVPSAWGGSQTELVIREGADPLYVESYKLFRRLVAGGSPLLAMMDVPALLKLMDALKEKVEYRAPVTASTVTPTAPVADAPKKPVVDG